MSDERDRPGVEGPGSTGAAAGGEGERPAAIASSLREQAQEEAAAGAGEVRDVSAGAASVHDVSAGAAGAEVREVPVGATEVRDVSAGATGVPEVSAGATTVPDVSSATVVAGAGATEVRDVSASGAGAAAAPRLAPVRVDAGEDRDAPSGPIVFGPFTAERPELLVGAAFVAAFLVARILKRITD